MDNHRGGRAIRAAAAALLIGTLAGCAPGAPAASTPAVTATPAATPTVRPSPTAASVGAADVLRQLRSPTLAMAFDLEGTVERESRAAGLNGRVELTDAAMHAEIEVEADSDQLTFEAISARGYTYIRLAAEEVWFDRSEDHAGFDLGTALRTLAALRPEGTEGAGDARRWCFSGDPAGVGSGLLPGITTTAASIEADVELLTDASGALDAIEIEATWTDAGGDHYALSLVLARRTRDPDPIAVPDELWVRHVSPRFEYSIGMPEGIDLQTDISADVDMFFMSDQEFVGVTREDQGGPADLNAYVDAFVAANDELGWTLDNSGTLNVRGRAFPYFVYTVPTNGADMTYVFALTAAGRYGYQVMAVAWPENITAVMDFMPLVLSTFYPSAT